MRHAWLAILLLAGCTSSGPGPVDGDAGIPAYALDCSIGSDWSEPCLSWASPNESPSKTEIDIAVNPTDPRNIFVASKDLDPLASDCVWAVGQASHDGGHTWQTTYIGGRANERSPGDALWGWDCITDPIMQFEPDGTLHYALQVYVHQLLDDNLPDLSPRPTGGMMMHAISYDGGLSFPVVFQVQGSDGGVVINDYMRMGHNPMTGTVFTTWHQIHSGTGVVWPVISAVPSGQAQARPPVYFPSVDDATGLVAKGLAGGPEGDVYVMFVDYDERSRVLWAASSDDGRKFSTPAEVFRITPMREDDMPVEFRTSTSTEIAVDASGGPRHGCIYATWPDGGLDIADVRVRRSCDGGSSWGDEVTLHNESGGAQFFPRISVDGRGGVHVVYHTQAYDPDHVLLDTEWAFSDDGGATWATRRLTKHSYDGDLGLHQAGYPFFGDYIGIASAGDHTYMGFPTTLTGRAEIAVAHVSRAGHDE